MLSVPQLEAAVKSLPAPIHLKEQILDAALGQHDALHRPERRRKTVRPLSDRVAEARKIGGFDHLRTERNGDDVYAYCKKGVPFYRLTVRCGAVVHCTCRNYEMESAIDPEYRCKHFVLFEEAGQTTEEMIADVAARAAAFERAWFERRFGLGTAEAEGEAYRALAAARERVRGLIPSEGETVSLTGSGRGLPGLSGDGRDGPGA